MGGRGLSRLCIMCLSNYVNSVELLSTCSDLDNKVVIQLTTGTASDASSFENLVKQKRGRYLDGAPEHIPVTLVIHAVLCLLREFSSLGRQRGVNFSEENHNIWERR